MVNDGKGKMKQIKLTQNKVALVDDEDYDFLSNWKWFASWDGHNWYARRNSGVYPFRRQIQMHRVIMDVTNELEVDHKDGNGLNNQKYNLRICTHAKNTINKKKHVDNTSGYKGVTFNKATGKYVASIYVDGKRISLGYFVDIIDAAKTYDKAAIKYFGEYSKTNFQQGD